jgi:hypothetical protein
MILLHLTQFGVTVAADGYALIRVCPACDMVKFVAARIGFGANETGPISVALRIFGIGALLAATVPANDRATSRDHRIWSELKTAPIVLAAGAAWAMTAQPLQA